MEMMNLKDVNDALDHKIVGGSEYQWHCYPEARYMDYESEHAHACVLFSTETQVIYSAEINDKVNKHKPYRWLNPFYKDAYLAEAKQRGVNPNQAWDDTEWYDLEVPEDWLEKANAIFNGEEFDSRIQMQVDLEDDLILQLAVEAHKRDITLNKMMEIVLQTAIDHHRVNESLG
jgi:hypothetical protein